MRHCSALAHVIAESAANKASSKRLDWLLTAAIRDAAIDLQPDVAPSP